jgi:hypothetical protein
MRRLLQRLLVEDTPDSPAENRYENKQIQIHDINYRGLQNLD